jgi:hypothetical protein
MHTGLCCQIGEVSVLTKHKRGKRDCITDAGIAFIGLDFYGNISSHFQSSTLHMLGWAKGKWIQQAINKLH